jgi:hypothetical protein
MDAEASGLGLCKASLIQWNISMPTEALNAVLFRLTMADEDDAGHILPPFLIHLTK